MNKVILVGTLDKSPDLRKTANGTSVISFILRTKDKFIDFKTKESRVISDFHRCVYFGDVEGLDKGSLISCYGKIKTRKYEEKYITEINLEKINLLSASSGQESLDDDIPF